MKKITVLFIVTALVGFFATGSFAQQTAPATLSTVVAKGSTVEFTLASSRPFIFGNNRYVLHIGDKVFFRNRQSYDEVTLAGTLTFMIEKSDFDGLQNGKGIYLTYGYAEETEQALEEFAKNSFPGCWPLGKFSKDILSR